MKKLLITLGCILLTFSLSACEKITPVQPGPGELLVTKIGATDSIPAEYGELIDVTTHASYEGWSQLWFEDEQQTIRMIRVQFSTKRVHEDVLVIPRN